MYAGRRGVLYRSSAVCGELCKCLALPIDKENLLTVIQLRMDKIIDICHRSGAQVSVQIAGCGLVLIYLFRLSRQYTPGKNIFADAK